MLSGLCPAGRFGGGREAWAERLEARRMRRWYRRVKRAELVVMVGPVNGRLRRAGGQVRLLKGKTTSSQGIEYRIIPE